jgi:hypothetical protein
MRCLLGKNPSETGRRSNNQHGNNVTPFHGGPHFGLLHRLSDWGSRSVSAERFVDASEDVLVVLIVGVIKFLLV